SATTPTTFTIGSDESSGTPRDKKATVGPGVTRTFTSFSQPAEENGQSPIYLGIHWQFDKVQGIAQGTAIADYVFAHFLRPRGSQASTAHVSKHTVSSPSFPGDNRALLGLASFSSQFFVTPSLPVTRPYGPVVRSEGTVPPFAGLGIHSDDAWTGGALSAHWRDGWFNVLENRLVKAVGG